MIELEASVCDLLSRVGSSGSSCSTPPTVGLVTAVCSRYSVFPDVVLMGRSTEFKKERILFGEK